MIWLPTGLNAMDSLIQRHHGPGRGRLSTGGGNKVLAEWNEDFATKRQDWSPYTTYASFTNRRGLDTKNLKAILESVGHSVGNATGGGTASGNTGGNDEDHGPDGNSAENNETADANENMEVHADGDNMEDVKMEGPG